MPRGGREGVDMTITEAIRQVLKKKRTALTVAEIYASILDQNLFEFKSQSAASIVRSQIRRHCEGVPSAHGSAKKLFRLKGADRYELIDADA